MSRREAKPCFAAVEYRVESYYSRAYYRRARFLPDGPSPSFIRPPPAPLPKGQGSPFSLVFPPPFFAVETPLSRSLQAATPAAASCAMRRDFYRQFLARRGRVSMTEGAWLRRSVSPGVSRGHYCGGHDLAQLGQNG